ncbi:MAG: hypothetical protein K5790_10355 [Nitrosopumilus sp.]|uniref:hypothetical protein n=1 Tax=Nitrosopumilus sp. TaxID=2024843 RepID=UPI00247E631C|nr:hypothetical protein [Nitrosopumilus sp.]MCV0393671.1 hypothetical protein [Nitrosopumilus sp.]
MGIRKDWIDEEIGHYKEKMYEEADSLKRKYYEGIVMGLEIARKELTKPPRTKAEIELEKKNKIFDPNKMYDDIVTFYMNQKKFIDQYPDIEIRKKKANEIALQKCQEEQQKRMNQYE